MAEICFKIISTSLEIATADSITAHALGVKIPGHIIDLGVGELIISDKPVKDNDDR